MRDEIEHLLDDNEDMGQLYLTRKWIQNQQSDASLGVVASNSTTATVPHLRRLSSTRSGSAVTSNLSDDNDVEDLEMLLEAYFMQLDGTRNRILSVRSKFLHHIMIKFHNLAITRTMSSFSLILFRSGAGVVNY